MKNKINSIIAIAGVTVITLVILSQITSFRKTPSNVFGSDTTTGLTVSYSGAGQSTSVSKRYSTAGTTAAGNTIYTVCNNCNTGPNGKICSINKNSEEFTQIYFSSSANGDNVIKFQSNTTVNIVASNYFYCYVYYSLNGYIFQDSGISAEYVSSCNISIPKNGYYKLYIKSNNSFTRTINSLTLTYDCDPSYIEPEPAKFSGAGTYTASTSQYNLSFTMNEDFTGVYQFTKISSGVVNTTYVCFEFKKDSTAIFLGVKNPNKTSSAISTSGNYNMFTNDVSETTFTLGSDTISFNTYYSSGSQTTPRTLTKQ